MFRFTQVSSAFYRKCFLRIKKWPINSVSKAKTNPLHGFPLKPQIQSAEKAKANPTNKNARLQKQKRKSNNTHTHKPKAHHVKQMKIKMIPYMYSASTSIPTLTFFSQQLCLMRLFLLTQFLIRKLMAAAAATILTRDFMMLLHQVHMIMKPMLKMRKRHIHLQEQDHSRMVVSMFLNRLTVRGCRLFWLLGFTSSFLLPICLRARSLALLIFVSLFVFW